MKLAEALVLRSDAQKRLEQLRSRAVAAARYQEGEEPAESSADLLAEAKQVVGEVEELIRRINRTNAATELIPGVTISDAIARRDALATSREIVTAVADAAAGRDSAQRYRRQLHSELRELTDLPVSELRHDADDLARQYRELDVQLQQANWSTELLE